MYNILSYVILCSYIIDILLFDMKRYLLFNNIYKKNVFLIRKEIFHLITFIAQHLIVRQLYHVKLKWFYVWAYFVYIYNDISCYLVQFCLRVIFNYTVLFLLFTCAWGVLPQERRLKCRCSCCKCGKKQYIRNARMA